MAVFDVSKKWRILAPASVPAAWNAADELALYISLLRNRAGIDKNRPPVEDAETASPPGTEPIIILSAAAEGRDRNGFTWRIGKGRIEIRGDSGRGLWNALFDFLAALGILWSKPGQEELPSPPAPGVYPLKKDRAYSPSVSSVQGRRRLVIVEKTSAKKREQLVRWAARNKYDALVFSLGEKSLWNKMRRGRGIYAELTRYALILEAGGWDLSNLLPRRLFFFHRDLFRMDSGKRARERHFCPTNPQTITRIKALAGELFKRAMPGVTAQSVFHLWPDHGHESTWCACPACRAFSPSEQNRIAINSAADVLLSLDPKARLSYFEDHGEVEFNGETPAVGGIIPRENTFALTQYPDKI